MSKNPHSTSIGPENYWPLNVEQREAFHEAAVEADDLTEKLTGLVLLHSGMRNSEYYHMRSDWLEVDTDGELRIVVPDTAVCTGGAGETGRNNETGEDLHSRGTPCYHCRASTPKWVKTAKRDPSYHDEKWHPKTRAAAGRPIPIEELDEDAAEILDWWFQQNEEIPLTHKSVNSRLEKIRERAGIDRPITAHDLRTTFATDLARNGVKRTYTRDLMGHELTSSTDPYYKFVGADLKSELRDKLRE